MQRTVKIKLNLDDRQVDALRNTQRICAEIFNDHSTWSYDQKTWSKARAHVELYAAERSKHSLLPAAMVQTVRDQALEACKACKLKGEAPRKLVDSAIRYDQRLFTLRGEQLTLASTEGRLKTIIKLPVWCNFIVKAGKLKQVNLLWDRRQKRYNAALVYNLDEVAKRQEGSVIGLDRGLINIVTTSEGVIVSSKEVRKNQRKHLYLRKRLSAKGTRSAKRLMKKLSGKEKRFSREQNHLITKELASQLGVKTYVVEDLRGIRAKRRGKKLNKLMSSWSFAQLETLLRYKCEAAGIEVVQVSARFTSQRCSQCGLVCKDNRQGGRYVCSKCGMKMHADINAAINIRDRWILQSSQRLHVGQGDVNRPDGDGVESHQAPRLRPCAVTH